MVGADKGEDALASSPTHQDMIHSGSIISSSSISNEVRNPLESAADSSLTSSSLQQHHRAIIINPLETTSTNAGTLGGISSGGSQLQIEAPPPSYHDIPGTVPAHQGVSRGPPPSYEDAVDPNAEPPSYDSLFGRIRDTHKASRNFFDFLIKFILLIMGTIGCTIVCSVTVIIPICMIVIGSLYFNQCPAEPYIPIFLILGGSLSVFKYFLGVTARLCFRGRDNTRDHNRVRHAQSLITFFLCGWFIGGCVWVYRIYWPNFEPRFLGDTDYCHQAVYVFTYWIITTSYIFLGMFTSCICCSSITSVILNRD